MCVHSQAATLSPFLTHSLFSSLLLSFKRTKTHWHRASVRLYFDVYLCLSFSLCVCVYLRTNVVSKANDEAGAEAEGQIRFFCMWTIQYIAFVFVFSLIWLNSFSRTWSGNLHNHIDRVSAWKHISNRYHTDTQLQWRRCTQLCKRTKMITNYITLAS